MWVATTARPGSSGFGQVVGVGEPADVVTHHRTGAEGLPRHRGAPGVDRDRDVATRAAGPGWRGRPDRAPRLEADLGAGARLDPTDIQDVGALRHQRLGAPQEGVEGEGRTPVVEGVRRPVEDPHDQRTESDVVAPAPEDRSSGAGARVDLGAQRLRTGGWPAPCGSGRSGGRRGPASRGGRRTPGGRPRRRCTRSSRASSSPATSSSTWHVV